METLRRYRSANFTIAVANFLAYFVGMIVIDGSAMYGREIDGHYFVGGLGRYSHHLKEVSHAVFIYSSLHAISVLVTVPLAFIAAALGPLDDR